MRESCVTSFTCTELTKPVLAQRTEARPLGPTSPRDYFTGRKSEKGVARGWLRLADNLSSCNLTSQYLPPLPVTSFLVHRRPFWVSHIPHPPHRLPRVCWHPLRLDSYGSNAYNAIVTLDGAKGSWDIESLLKLPEGTQPQISPGELLACEAIVKNDARVQALAKEVGESFRCRT